MSFGRWIQLALGVLLDVFGFVILVGGLLGIGEDQSEEGHILGILALGLVPMAVGSFLIYRVVAGLAREKREALERELLELAARSGGRLSPSVVARETSLTLDEAKRKLDAIHLAGHCRTELLDDGTMVYLFD